MATAVLWPTMTCLEAIMGQANFSEMAYSLKHWLLNILVFYKPSSSEEALLSPHSVLTSFKMRLVLFLILCSRISACVLDNNFLFGGKSRPLCTANSSNSYNKKINYSLCIMLWDTQYLLYILKTLLLWRKNTFLETRICFTSLW